MAQISWLNFLGTVLASLIFLVITFIPMERVFPAKKGQPILRPGWSLDLWYFLGQYLFWIALVFWVLDTFEHWLDPWVPPAFRAAVAAQPWGWQALEVIVLSDVLVY
jgi:hypothetical protein